MRLKTPAVQIGNLYMGSVHPIMVQSMTSTDTADARATAAECIQLARAGSEIVRMTVNNEEAAEAVPEIRRLLIEEGFEHLPLVGDFHYNGHILLTKFPECARTLDKYRINPGNVGYGEKNNYNFATIIKCARRHDKPVRIGVNWGSLDHDLLTEMMEENAKKPRPQDDREVVIQAMVESAMRSSLMAEELGMARNKIVVSVKMSVVQDMIAAYERLAQRMKKEKRVYALHLGLTEAGAGVNGIVSSSAALAILLQQGIGDTIRVSLTPAPGSPRTREVEVCHALLQSMGYRHFKPKVTSCPGCGRTDSTFFQELAAEVHAHIDAKMHEWKTAYPRVAELKIAVMGCIVNGPGESRHADIAISLPGNNEQKMAPVFIRGRYHSTLTGTNLAPQFIALLEEFIRENYAENLPYSANSPTIRTKGK